MDMFVCCVGSGLCDELITGSRESCWVCVCFVCVCCVVCVCVSVVSVCVCVCVCGVCLSVRDLHNEAA